MNLNKFLFMLCLSAFLLSERDASAQLTVTDSLVTNVLCNGGSTGSISFMNISGGNSPYTYSWTPSAQITDTASGLAAGTYTLNVTDINGSTGSAVANITQPNALGISAAATANVSCNGASNGSASSVLTGGTSPYTYSWTNGSTTDTATGLSAGTYTLTVNDSCGGSASTSVNISEPNVIGVSASATNVTCNGANNGIAMATMTGGTSPYVYSWSDANSQATANATGLTPGTYTVTVNDSCGGTATTSVIITEPVVLTASANISTNVSCNGGNNGSSSANVNGGTSPYAYLWSDVNSQTGATATGLTAGTYTLNVTDNNNCTASATVVITEPLTALTTTAATITNVLCNGGNNGMISSGASGGTSPYIYSWTGGQTNATASDLTAGTYTVNVTDNNNCTASASATITQPNLLTVLINNTGNVFCNGGNNGSVSSAVSGGVSPYIYSWSDANSQATANATGLSAGTYNINVTDNNNCTASASVVVTEPITLSVSASASVNVLCNGGNNGNASSLVSGGTFPFTYSWSNSQTTATAIGLTAGTYTLNVKDNNGCTASANTTITEPLTLAASATEIAAVLCSGGNNGSASSAVAGGTVPYNYFWSNGQTSDTASGLSAGTYTLTLTDNNGCTITANTTITQPVVLTASANNTANVGCNGGNNGSASSVVSGGKLPYTYLWSNSQATANVGGLIAGIYTVNVQDNNGCVASAFVTITQPVTLAASVSTISNVLCNGSNTGSASPIVSGGTAPYSYLWTAGGGTNAATNTLAAGIDTISVTDAHGCSLTAATVVSQPSALAIIKDSTPDNGTCMGAAWVIVTGGITPYTYLWANGNTTYYASGLCPGSYCCTIADSNGCLNNVCITVYSAAGINNIASDGGKINVYPNPSNGQFTIESTSTVGGASSVEIYNVLGAKVYSMNLSTGKGGNTTVNMGNQPNGIYLYRVISNENGNLLGEGKIVLQK